MVVVDFFGSSVAISGDQAIIGAYGDDAGAVYIFEPTGSSWVEEQKLTAGDGTANDNFGISVAISGDHFVVGASEDDNDNGNSAGSAYIFERSGSSWVEEQKLMASDGTDYERFGKAVSISDNLVIIGVSSDDNNTGAAYIFERTGTNWVEGQKLTASDGSNYDRFGWSVAVAGEVAIIGTIGVNNSAGSAYLYSGFGEAPLSADFLGNMTTGNAPLTVQFTDTSTGTPTSWEWDFDNNGVIDSYEQNPQWTYYQGGLFSVSLTIDDETNQDTIIKSDYITVNQPLTPDFTATPLSGDVPLTVQFTDMSTGYPIVTWRWRFGSLVTDSYAQNPIWTFEESGVFNVYLTITNGETQVTEVKEDYIFVNVIADFSADVIQGQTMQLVNFADMSISNAVSWQWDFNNDGIIDSYAESPSWIYAQPGTYTVSLMVSDGLSQDTEIKTDYITITGNEITEEKIIPSDAATSGYFGKLVSISGDYAFVKSNDDPEPPLLHGSVYVFKWDGISWTEHQKITISDEENSDDRFGISLSVSGNYMIAGVRSYGGNTTVGGGYAYIFKREGNSWVEHAILTPNENVYDSYFGASVGVYGDYAMVGSIRDDGDSTSTTGSVSVFHKAGNSWVEQQKLRASDQSYGDFFGRSISIYNDYAIVGATGNDDNGEGSGSAYIFKREGSTWVEKVKLTASDGAAEDFFGVSVAIASDYAIVGSDISVYIFQRNGNNWTEQQKLTVSAGDLFGVTVDICNDYAIVGDQVDGSNSFGSGSAFIFQRTGDTWVEIHKLMPLDGANGDDFGNSVSISGENALVSARSDYNSSGIGSAYIYSGFGGCIEFNANFSTDTTSGTSPLTVQFTDTSYGEPTSWQWDFNTDDTIDSEEQNPTWTYETDGTYTVSLIASDGTNEDTEIKENYITVGGEDNVWTTHSTSTSNIASDHIGDVDIDSNGNIWFSAFPLGVSVYNGADWFTYNASNSGLASELVYTLAIDNQGYKWFGAYEGGVSMYDGSNWTVYNTANSNIVSDRIVEIAIDQQNRKWFGSYEDGISVYNGAVWNTFTTANGLPSNSISSITAAGNGDVWVGTIDDGVAVYNGTTWTIYNTANSGLADDRVRAVGVDSQNRVWCGTFGGGVSVLDGNSWTTYDQSNSGLGGNNVMSITIDQQDRTWIGTYYNGVSVFDGTDWTVHHVNNSGLTNDDVRSIVIDNEGNKWFGTWGGGASKYGSPGTGGSFLYLSPSILNFLEVPVGDEAVLIQSLTNHDSEPITVSNIAINGTDLEAFTIINDGETPTLAPGEIHYVVVQFAPTTTNSMQATLTIDSDAPGSPHTANLVGTGGSYDIVQPAKRLCAGRSIDHHHRLQLYAKRTRHPQNRRGLYGHDLGKPDCHRQRNVFLCLHHGTDRHIHCGRGR
ncbi:MAG: hypothetical protein B6244_05535 [Candidatus Cloacimonetes bacterium 4572_55]|nr:MAG: hypothetical protein B6244_05535 [Candidatus Cloacimonetes bacterium 4572_55]